MLADAAGAHADATAGLNAAATRAPTAQTSTRNFLIRCLLLCRSGPGEGRARPLAGPQNTDRREQMRRLRGERESRLADRVTGADILGIRCKRQPEV